MKVNVIIIDKETNLESEPVDIMDFINGENIEFCFPDNTTLPLNDFRFFRYYFEVKLVLEDK